MWYEIAILGRYIILCIFLQTILLKLFGISTEIFSLNWFIFTIFFCIFINIPVVNKFLTK